MVFTNLGELKLVMKINSGIDLVEVERLRVTYKNFGDRFLTRIYDPLEIEQFNKKSKRAKPNFLAKNFAAKEAVSKVLGVAKLGTPVKITPTTKGCVANFTVTDNGSSIYCDGAGPAGCDNIEFSNGPFNVSFTIIN